MPPALMVLALFFKQQNLLDFSHWFHKGTLRHRKDSSSGPDGRSTHWGLERSHQSPGGAAGFQGNSSTCPGCMRHWLQAVWVHTRLCVPPSAGGTSVSGGVSTALYTQHCPKALWAGTGRVWPASPQCTHTPAAVLVSRMEWKLYFPFILCLLVFQTATKLLREWYTYLETLTNLPDSSYSV